MKICISTRSPVIPVHIKVRRTSQNQHISEIQQGRKAMDSRPHLVIKLAVWPWTNPEVGLSFCLRKTWAEKLDPFWRSFLLRLYKIFQFPFLLPLKLWEFAVFPKLDSTWPGGKHKPPVMLQMARGHGGSLPLLGVFQGEETWSQLLKKKKKDILLKRQVLY